MARKTKRTPEQIVTEWIAGSVPDHIRNYSVADIQEMGWEPGQVGAMKFDGMNVERFTVPEGYVVIEWSPEEGLISVVQRRLERWEREELGI